MYIYIKSLSVWVPEKSEGGGLVELRFRLRCGGGGGRRCKGAGDARTRIESTFPNALICTTRRCIPASTRTKQGPKNGGLILLCMVVTFARVPATAGRHMDSNQIFRFDCLDAYHRSSICTTIALICTILGAGGWRPLQGCRSRLGGTWTRIKSSVSIALICTTSRWIPASARTNQEPDKCDLVTFARVPATAGRHIDAAMHLFYGFRV